MIEIGTVVKVVRGSDETFTDAFLSKVGRVVEVHPDDCGASEKDPMWSVKFIDDVTEQFWSEELEVVT